MKYLGGSSYFHGNDPAAAQVSLCTWGTQDQSRSATVGVSSTTDQYSSECVNVGSPGGPVALSGYGDAACYVEAGIYFIKGGKSGYVYVYVIPNDASGPARNDAPSPELANLARVVASKF